MPVRNLIGQQYLLMNMLYTSGDCGAACGLASSRLKMEYYSRISKHNARPRLQDPGLIISGSKLGITRCCCRSIVLGPE